MNITIELTSLAEALTVERALISRAVSLENIAKESFRRAPEYPEIPSEYESRAQELRRLAEEIGNQAVRQAKGEKRDTLPTMSEAHYLNLVTEP